MRELQRQKYHENCSWLCSHYGRSWSCSDDVEVFLGPRCWDGRTAARIAGRPSSVLSISTLYYIIVSPTGLIINNQIISIFKLKKKESMITDILYILIYQVFNVL